MLLDSPRVAPSILASDFARLGAQVAEVMAAGARVIHVDVMDGHFVPPITIGPAVVDALRPQVQAAGGWLDVHLMIERPERVVGEYAKAGANSISVHAEATPHIHYALKSVREAGCLAGLALNPGTPASSAAGLPCDILLCMTVNPGWGGQHWIGGSEAKVAELSGHAPRVEVDGGVDIDTIGGALDAGASLFVAGTSIFGAPDPGAAYSALAARVQDPGAG